MSLAFPGGLILKLAAESDFVSVPGTCRTGTPLVPGEPASGSSLLMQKCWATFF